MQIISPPTVFDADLSFNEIDAWDFKPQGVVSWPPTHAESGKICLAVKA
jgi:hypothetical protein